MPGLALVGVGAGLSIASLSATAMAAVPGSRAGMAAGAVNTFRQLGYAFGIAVLGEVFRGGLQHAAGRDLAGALSGGQAGAVIARSPGLAHLVHRAFADSLDLTFVVAAGFGLVAAVIVLAFVRPRSALPRRPPHAGLPGQAPSSDRSRGLPASPAGQKTIPARRFTSSTLSVPVLKMTSSAPMSANDEIASVTIAGEVQTAAATMLANSSPAAL